MKITQLSVQNVRSHAEKTIPLSAGVTVITGKNGVGKTTLLEAIYITLQGSSFKGGDPMVLRKDAPWYRIDVKLEDEALRTVTFDPSRTSGKKRFVVDEKTAHRLTPKYKYPVILFEPDDLRLLSGSPARRRLFIDRFISQLDPSYATMLRKYERALKQRNTLLKQEGVSNDDLFVWNIALSEYGAKIIAWRKRAVEQINQRLNDFYHEIAHTDDAVSVEYSEPHDHTAQSLLQALEAKLPYDAIVKHTSVGPHRHDILFNFNDAPALTVASRGEVRTILLALKRIEEEKIKETTGHHPVVLLDDVFSELDKSRQDYIIDYFKKNQVVISSATALTYEGFLQVEL